MKVREGFVSNSSSSSFIVAFPKKPESLEDVAFALGNCEVDPYGTFVSSERVAEIVWGDIQRMDAEAARMAKEGSEEEDGLTREMSSKAYQILHSYRDDCKFRDRPDPTMALIRGMLGHAPTKLPRAFPEERATRWIELSIQEEEIWRERRELTEKQLAAQKKKQQKIYKEKNDIEKELTVILVEQWKKHYSGRVQYRFSYSDNDGAEMSAMEHGGVFRNLPHECISHH